MSRQVHQVNRNQQPYLVGWVEVTKPNGKKLAAEVLAKVGESMGESLGKKIVDVVEDLPEHHEESNAQKHEVDDSK